MSDKLLLIRIQNIDGYNTIPINTLVDKLQNKHREYTRHNTEKFTRMIDKALSSKGKSTSFRSFDIGDDVDTDEHPDALVEKTFEPHHLKRRRVKVSELNEEEKDITRVLGPDEEPKFDVMKEMLRKRYSKVKNNLMKEGNINTPVKSVKPSPKKPKSLVNDDGVDGNVKGNADGPRFKDLGGMDDVLEELKREVIVPLYYPQLPRGLGVRQTSGILLHGPPGCGKTKLALAIANETGLPFYKISATELVSGITGASEENIRELFAKAYKTEPSIVFIDEIDAIASKRENHQREIERRVVTQLMICMDESHRVTTDGKVGYVLVIGATNRPDAVDQALRRPGRFDREIALGVPDENARIKILTVLTRSLKLEGAFDLVKISRSTPGFVGADLKALVDKAGNIAMNRIIDGRKVEVSIENADTEENEDWWKKLAWSPEEMEKLSITMSDFEMAAKLVQPSTRREGFSSIPNVKWEDVGGLDSLRSEFEHYIVERIIYPDEYEEDEGDLNTGFLLYGPPGCGKTLIAKAVANEAGANFIHIKGPELLNKYVGESERAVRTIFSRARTCSPCILFFDEVDALTTNRGKEGGWVVERLVNQLLIELDGADQRKGVYIIGATNRPEVMDKALLRPGRFGRKLYVPLPNQDERGLILKALAKKKQLDTDVDLVAIGQSNACANFSGADLSALISEAANAARKERISKIKAATAAAVEGTSGSLSQSFRGGLPRLIKAAHFDQALRKISPSVSEKQMQYYLKLQESFE
ncbi:cell division cycle 48C [Artemisia annua]|uniref:Cell division cycle 48C n=1 Tax=Artemisia annua TaxID=35608 RepID=A0A2U1N312_ARTAN|nr:cell division cycle 48C [Artemisia annua]